MNNQTTFKSHKNLFLNTFAFTVCFAAWMLNGVLVTYLSANQVFDWGTIQIGWLMGIPVLTGAIFRLPAGMLTDKFGGKPVFGSLLILSAIPMFLLSYADSFNSFALFSFGFGFVGISFSIGIAFTSVWYPRERQGTALGIFGAGNAGAALTTLFAPTLLNRLTDNGVNVEGWRTLPMIYAGILIVTAVIFLIFSNNKKPTTNNKTMIEMLQPLKDTLLLFSFRLFCSLFPMVGTLFCQCILPSTSNRGNICRSL
jgi:NNP family nitrate/nitrite transporter-like MFS transporter